MKFLYTLGILLTMGLLLAACQGSAEKTSKPSADWSRGVEAGNFVTGSIGITIQGAGERVHMAWPADMGEGSYIRYIQLDAQATRTIEQNLDLSGLLRAPRLVQAEGDQLHLFWSSRQPGEKNWVIWHSMLDAAGKLSGPTQQISQPELSTTNYVVASDHAGGALICWDSSTANEIYLQHVDRAGSPVDEPVLITAHGQFPSIWVEPNGDVFLAWQEEGSFLYGRTTLAQLTTLETTVIGEIPQGTGKTIQGPYLGVAGNWAYVFWSELNRSGMEEGTGYTVYTAFPPDSPSKGGGGRMLLSPAEEQTYASYQGSLSLTQLAAPVEEAWAATDYVLSPSVVQGSQADELAIALAMNQDMRTDTHLQIAVAVFRDGQFAGYSLATKTENISDDPVLFLDTGDHLHLAWRLGSTGSSVYYATTQPSAVAQLERLGGSDIINAIFQGGMEGLVGITFLPIIGFGWLLPGMVIMVLVKIFRDQDSLTELKYWIPLVLSILIFYVVKLATLPTISTYVPFSAWIDIPERFWVLLRYTVPVLILFCAILVADRVRRKKSSSAIMFYITFVLVDAVLTLGIYGVNFLGSY